MNSLIIIIGILLTILIIYTLINSYIYLNNNNNNNNNNDNDNNNNNDDINKIIKDEHKDEKNFNKEELLIKYSSIKNKLETNLNNIHIPIETMAF